jgi:putative phosphoribosyl transferase
VLTVRKLGVPHQPELAAGAIVSGGAVFLNQQVLQVAGVSAAALNAIEARGRAELERREKLYRGTRPPPDVRGRTVIVVDDGMATGASMQAAVMALRSLLPARIVAAVPVAPADAARRMEGTADEFACVVTSVAFYAVGQFYRDFEQVTDAEVRDLLDKARKELV